MGAKSITSDPAVALMFLVEFAQMPPLATLKPRALLALLKNIHAFIYRESPDARFSDLSDLIPDLQRKARSLLENIAQGGSFTVAGDLVLSFYVMRSAKAVRLQVLGSPLHLMLYQAVKVLELVGTEKLRRCESQKRGTVCGRLFVKVTQKRFCSTRCQSREVMQKVRAREKREQEKAYATTKTRTR